MKVVSQTHLTRSSVADLVHAEDGDDHVGAGARALVVLVQFCGDVVAGAAAEEGGVQVDAVFEFFDEEHAGSRVGERSRVRTRG